MYTIEQTATTRISRTHHVCDSSLTAEQKLETFSSEKLADILTLATVMKGLFTPAYVELVESVLAQRCETGTNILQFAH